PPPPARQSTHEAVRCGCVSVVAYQRRRRDGGRPGDERREPLRAMLGRAERVRDRRGALPPELLLQPDSHDRRPRLLDGRCDQARLPEVAGQVDRVMKCSIALASLGFTAALTALAQSPDFARKPPGWQVALEASKDSAAGKAIAAKGKGAAIACVGCHGANGMPAAGTPFPRLAGLPVEYVSKQLFDYRDGSRANAIMEPVGKALTDAEIASLAWYYSSLEVPPSKAAWTDHSH